MDRRVRAIEALIDYFVGRRSSTVAPVPATTSSAISSRPTSTAPPSRKGSSSVWPPSLLIAGVDTTWSAIGSSLWHLATHDDDRARLVGQPDLMPTAVEEMLGPTPR